MDMEMQRPEETSSPVPAMNTLLERLLDEVENGAAEAPRQADQPEAAPVSPSAPTGGGSGLGALLANPALLSALPTLAENLAPLLGGLTGGVGSAHSATRPHTLDRHTALLCAIKPYLSPRRQEAAETVIRLCRVWDALERSGISLTGLLAGVDKAASTGSGKEVT